MLLAPHHCSKSIMYWKGPEDKKEQLKQDILDDLEAAAGTIGYIIASCDPIPASNKEGDNPPHAIAAARYKEIAPSGFLCTQEHPNKEAPEPIVFVLGENGFEYEKPGASAKAAKKTLAEAVVAARGGVPPTQRVGFGQRS
jgi:Na+-transporting NADH:ubiquinone oxidoreductase subunit NqrF